MGQFFGTDGIRGPFGHPPLDRDTVTRLGLFVGRRLQAESEAPTVILGGDTRESTPTLCSWLASGLETAGVRARYAGVLPSPGIAHLVRKKAVAAGLVVSASHNPHPDNGIKLLNGDGFKWSKDEEAWLEEQLRVVGEPVPRKEIELLEEEGLSTVYMDLLRRGLASGQTLEGLHVVLDLANGAAAPFAERLFRDLGARTEVLSDQPDGKNINANCGSTFPQPLAEAVVSTGADLGLAFDGDADRALLVDETGQIRDGDAILYLWATSLMASGQLDPARIVATSMSNLGLERALAAHGIGVERCDVGDRVVVETMRAGGYRLGGEQSGHIVDLDRTTTGDGLLTAIHMASLVVESGSSLTSLLAGFRRFPQVLHNLVVSQKPELSSLPRVQEVAQEIERELADDGRLVLRYSGTEPLARVMIEGPDEGRIETLAGDLIAAIDLDIARLRKDKEPS